MIEELKQRILAKTVKIPQYEQRIQQSRINRLFKVDQKKVYNEFNLMEKEHFKKNSQNEFKNKWHKKRMYGQFVHENA